jgi:endonuclease G, mitochondrial
MAKLQKAVTTSTPSSDTVDNPLRKGYNAKFLGKRLPLPKIKAKDSHLLNYIHYSMVFNSTRKMPYFTAVNIDAVSYNKLKPSIPSRKEMGADRWLIDGRLDKVAQIPKKFYSKNDFDLGHIVRREDVLWGDTLEEALAANDDSFYLTNACPQHKDFNRNAKRWKGLEDYALRSARKHDLRLSVFSGCVFSPDDRHLNDIRIPAQYWKILVMVKEDGELSATGYLVQQDDLIEDITERAIFVFEQFMMYQVPITEIEHLTGIRFGLNKYDPRQKVGERGILDPTPFLIKEESDIVF